MTTSFSGLNLDANVQENTGAFKVLPAGKYKACLVSDELKDNRAQTGKVWAVKLQILEGQFAGEILTDNINITNPSAKCQAIGQGTLKRICNLCAVPYPPQNTAGLMGKPIGITIDVEEFESNNPNPDGTKKILQSNKIRSYDPAPAKQAQEALAQSQAQPQAANAW